MVLDSHIGQKNSIKRREILLELESRLLAGAFV
jgi:hypothetical protein